MNFDFDLLTRGSSILVKVRKGWSMIVLTVLKYHHLKISKTFLSSIAQLTVFLMLHNLKFKTIKLQFLTVF